MQVLPQALLIGDDGLAVAGQLFDAAVGVGQRVRGVGDFLQPVLHRRVDADLRQQHQQAALALVEFGAIRGQRLLQPAAGQAADGDGLFDRAVHGNLEHLGLAGRHLARQPPSIAGDAGFGGGRARQHSAGHARMIDDDFSRLRVVVGEPVDGRLAHHALYRHHRLGEDDF